MKLFDTIAYFSRYLASLIDFPTKWSHIIMWLSMNALLVSSVSIVFGDQLCLNLANILHNFCVSQWGSSILLHTFQSISHHWFISLQIGFSLPCGCPWKQYCFVTGHYFDYHVSLNLANILHNFCVSQWGSSIVLHTFQVISHHWLISLQIGVTLTCGCPWMQILFRQCPLFSIIICP